PVSAEMARLIVRAAEFSALSGGAFDITYAAVGHLYDYRNRVRPSDDELARARTAVGWRHLVLDSQAGTARFARPGMRIDLGCLRALLRRRWHALSSPDRSGDRQIAARHTKRDSSCR